MCNHVCLSGNSPMVLRQAFLLHLCNRSGTLSHPPFCFQGAYTEQTSIQAEDFAFKLVNRICRVTTGKSSSGEWGIIITTVSLIVTNCVTCYTEKRQESSHSPIQADSYILLLNEAHKQCSDTMRSFLQRTG